MKYKNFTIERYRAIKQKIEIDLSKRIIPLVGINECGKTTILKALLCFDWANDRINNSEHLKTVYNLYKTKKKEPARISASIECNTEEFQTILNICIDSIEKSRDTERWKEEYETVINEIKAIKKDPLMIKEISITRVISETSKQYLIKELEKFSSATQEKISLEILRRLPYILYNDDFTDRPEQEIKLAGDKDTPSIWEDIFDNVVCSSSKDEYSLRDIFAENDSRRRNSMISDVMKFLNDELAISWMKFAAKGEKLKIKTRLEIEQKEKILRVYIVEELNGESRDFFINDRSKGFIWYYNFIMKIRFNPKKVDDEASTIFLLDEPGSYLHETAQDDLCKKLKEISNTGGCVVYCTHSPRLLSPEHIALSSIMVVERKKFEITATPLPVFKTTLKNSSAMQPVYEALQLPEYEAISKSEKILCVEGIYDKYAIASFCNFPENIRVFPSTGASSIIGNIPYFLAYNKDYVALWDCDKEGKRARGRASKLFGAYESEKFLLLPEHLKQNGNVRMEDMIDDIDYQMLKIELHLSSDANYEQVMRQLFFATNRNDIIVKASARTKENFSTLAKSVMRALKCNS